MPPENLGTAFEKTAMPPKFGAYSTADSLFPPFPYPEKFASYGSLGHVPPPLSTKKIVLALLGATQSVTAESIWFPIKVP